MITLCPITQESKVQKIFPQLGDPVRHLVVTSMPETEHWGIAVGQGGGT